MNLLHSLMRSLISGYGSLFGDAHPLVSLTPLAILTGIAMLWVFGKTSNQKAIERTKKRLQAYLLELRLFGDEPSLIFQSQKNLLLGNLRYMGLMLQPVVILTLPMIVLLVHLDAYYGRSPLRVGAPAVVTVQAASVTAADTPRLEAPPEIVVETPPVRVPDQAQFSWRIRPQHEVDTELQVSWGEARWTKTVAAGESARYLSTRRVRTWWEQMLDPGEDRLPGATVDWIEVPYPTANIALAGLDLHWLIWFFVISIVAAYLMKGYFGVVF